MGRKDFNDVARFPKFPRHLIVFPTRGGEVGIILEMEHGLVGQIRTSTTSEQFDLGGFTEIRAHDLINSAFSSPFPPLEEMIRITLVVGGGKNVRSRYQEELPKWVMTTLREIGYSEDRSAAETFDSQGTFKYQHDTGQNLKFIIIYPKVETLSSKAVSTTSESSMDPTSIPNLLIGSEFSTFQDMVNTKAPSWRQKKKLLKLLQEQMTAIQAIERKLVSGERLETSEQYLYDLHPGNLEEKINWVQQEIKTYVASNRLTQDEKNELLLTFQNNLSALLQEQEGEREREGESGAEAIPIPDPSKPSKIQSKIDQLNQRKRVVEAMTPIPNYRLRHAEEIQRLHRRLFPIYALEEKEKSCSLTLNDLKALEPKTEILSEISRLEAASQEWFEEPTEFLSKCSFEESQAKLKYSQKKNTSNGGGGGGGGKPKSLTASHSTISKSSSGMKYFSSTNKSAPKEKSTSRFAAFGDDDDD